MVESKASRKKHFYQNVAVAKKFRDLGIFACMFESFLVENVSRTRTARVSRVQCPFVVGQNG